MWQNIMMSTKSQMILIGSNIIVSIDAFGILYKPYIIIVISSPKSL